MPVHRVGHHPARSGGGSRRAALVTAQGRPSSSPTDTTFLAFLTSGSEQGGWLAGKKDLTREGPSAGSRVEWAQNAGWVEGNFDSFNTPYTWHVLDTVADVAAKTNKTPAQVSLRFVPPTRHASLHMGPRHSTWGSRGMDGSGGCCRSPG